MYTVSLPNIEEPKESKIDFSNVKIDTRKTGGLSNEEKKVILNFLEANALYNQEDYCFRRSKKGRMLLYKYDNPNQILASLEVKIRKYKFDAKFIESLGKLLSYDRIEIVPWKDSIKEIKVSLLENSSHLQIRFLSDEEHLGVKLPDYNVICRRNLTPLMVRAEVRGFLPTLSKLETEVARKCVYQEENRLIKEYGFHKGEDYSFIDIAYRGGIANKLQKIEDDTMENLKFPHRYDAKGRLCFETHSRFEFLYNPWTKTATSPDFEGTLEAYQKYLPWREIFKEARVSSIRIHKDGESFVFTAFGFPGEKYIILKTPDKKELKVLYEYQQKADKEKEKYEKAKKSLEERLPSGIKMDCRPIKAGLSYSLAGEYVVSEKYHLDYHKPYLAIFRETLKIILKEEEERKEQAINRIKSSPFVGSALGYAIAHMVSVNEDFISIRQLLGMLRGTSVNYREGLKTTEEGGKFRLIPASDVEEMMEELIEDGILGHHYRRGDYGSYVVIDTTKDTKPYLTLCKQIKNTEDPLTMNDFEIIHWLEEGNFDFDAEQIPNLIDSLLSRPQLYCLNSESYLNFFRSLPDQYKDYMKMLYDMEEDQMKRKMMREIKKDGKISTKNATPTKKEKTWHVEPKNGSNPYDPRYVVVDNASGKILDDAQGYGYKSRQKATAAYNYKTKDPAKKSAWAKKKQVILKWMKEHKSFVDAIDAFAMEIAMGKWGPDDKVDAKFVRNFAKENNFVFDDFTAGDFLKVWRTC